MRRALAPHAGSERALEGELRVRLGALVFVVAELERTLERVHE
jgi:hypothetical protein